MKCTPEQVDSKQVTNSDVSYRIVCCGEACSPERCQPNAHRCEDTWITLHLDVDHDKRLDEYKAGVAARHGKMKAWREKRG